MNNHKSPFSKEFLESKNIVRIVSHKDCSDGIASAILLQECFPEADVVFYQHGEDEPLPMEGTIFCDLAPHQNIDEHIKCGSLVLDHHATNKENVLKFQNLGLGVFGNEDSNSMESGGYMAWKYVHSVMFPNHHYYYRVMEFAQLVGIRDLGLKSNDRWDSASDCSCGLIFFGNDYFLDTMRKDPNRFWDEEFPRLHEIGRIDRMRRLKKVDDALGRALYFEENGIKVCVTEGTQVTTDGMMNLERTGKADVLIGFASILNQQTHKPELLLSCRSNGKISVKELCTKFNGGGHEQAAGCKIPTAPQFKIIEDIVREFIKNEN